MAEGPFAQYIEGADDVGGGALATISGGVEGAISCLTGNPLLGLIVLALAAFAAYCAYCKYKLWAATPAPDADADADADAAPSATYRSRRRRRMAVM